MTAELRAEVDALLADWAWHADHHEFDELADLYTPDALVHSGGVEFRGRNEIRRRYTSRTGTRATRHMYSCLRLTTAGQERVRALSTWAVYADNLPAPMVETAVYLVADFDDILTRCPDGRLRISERVITPVFRDPVRAPISS